MFCLEGFFLQDQFNHLGIQPKLHRCRNLLHFQSALAHFFFFNQNHYISIKFSGCIGDFHLETFHFSSFHLDSWNLRTTELKTGSE